MEFEIIKNRIKRFTLSSTVEQCIFLLNSVQINDQKDYPFWNILLLAKWSYMYTKDSVFLRKADLKEVEQTLILINKFENDSGVVKLRDGVKPGLRVIAFQQLWYQEQINSYSLARQYILYESLSSSVDINGSFQKFSGLTIKDFLKSMHLVIIYLMLTRHDKRFTYDGVLHEDFFDISKDCGLHDEVQRLISHLLLKRKSEVQKMHRMKKEVFQIYETNYWSRQPFITHNKKIRTLHKSIIDQTAKHHIYDFLKANDDSFTTEFGKRMERYIELGLNESKSNT